MFTLENDVKLYEPSIENRISSILRKLGMNVANKGFRYVKCAISLEIREPGSIDLITKVAYPYVAKQYSTKWSSVERAIRHAILGVDNEEFKKKVFGIDRDKHLSNKEFIAGVVEYINTEYGY